MAEPTSSRSRILHPALAIALGVAALIGLAVLPRIVPHRATFQNGNLVGKPAPDISLSVAANAQAGGRLNLADLKGKAVLLDFWASWCGPCAMEAPIVDRVARRYEKSGLVVVGVNVDDTPEVVRAYAAKKGLGYPMVVDAGKRVSLSYGIEKLPSLVVIDKQGNVKAFLAGMVDEDSLSEIVQTAL